MKPAQVATELAQLGGVCPAGQLIELWGRRSLMAAERMGAVVRLGRGRYGLPELHEAVRAAHRINGAAFGVSAALARGWPVLRAPDTTGVAVPRNRHLRDVSRGVSVHRVELTAAELAAGVTSPERTVVDCARHAPFDQGLAVADSALRSGELSVAELHALPVRRPSPGSARVDRVLRHASAAAANPVESALRAVTIELGYDFTAQYEINLGDHDVHVDLGDPSRRLALEAEGFAYNGSREAWRRDVRRYTSLSCLNWLVLRFTWDEVMFEQEWIRQVLMAAADRRAYRPTPLPAAAALPSRLRRAG